MTPDSLFDDILETLACDHAKLVARRRAFHRLDRLFIYISTELPDHPLLDLLPPRTVINRFRPRWREQLTAGETQKRAFSHCCEAHLARSESRPAWAGRMHEVVAGIISRVLGPGPFSYGDIQVHGICKEGQDFRPVTAFGFEDGIIERCFARYAGQLLDSTLLPCAVALPSSPSLLRCGSSARSRSG